jgi:hypothetical protein
VPRILDGELTRLTLQHPANADGGGLRFLGTIAVGALADVGIILPDAEIRQLQHVGDGEAPPRLIDGHDQPIWINQRDMGRQGIQDGGLRFRAVAASNEGNFARPSASTALPFDCIAIAHIGATFARSRSSVLY